MPQRKALLIGCPLGLQGPTHDVSAMEELLREQDFQVIRCCGPEATQTGIREAWGRLIEECQPADAVVIYYSGHGGLINGSGFRGPGLPACYQTLCPMDYEEGSVEDFRGILDFEITHLVRQTTDRTKNVTTIFDCCHSAHITRAPIPREHSTGNSTVTTVVRSLPRMTFDLTSYVRSLPNIFSPDPDGGVHLLTSLDNPYAVRIFAAEVDQKAYEYQKEDSSWAGAMTEALIKEIRQQSDRGRSWRTTIMKVREVVQRRFDQRPQSHGPDQRRLFSMEMTPVNVLHVKLQEGHPVMAGGSVLGVRRGDVYVIQPFGDEYIDEAACLGTATVVNLCGFQALLALNLRPGCSIPQDGALAFQRTNVADTDGFQHDNNSVQARIAGLVRSADVPGHRHGDGHEEGPPQLAMRCVTQDDSIILFAGNNLKLCEFANTSEGIQSVVDAAEQIVKAQHLLSLRCEVQEEQLQHRLQVSLTTQNQMDQTAVSVQTRGIEEEDYLRIRLQNLGAERLYVAVFEINVAGKITLLTRSTPCGKAMSSRQESTLGSNWLENRGLKMTWPTGIGRESPIQEHLVLVVTDHEADLRALETRKTSPTLRDVQRAAEIPHIRWAVLHLRFLLRPRPVADSGPGSDNSTDSLVQAR
ncbi:hypothetical protein ASPACDRAFT_120676 [Aspergillus aculeatus ATCC 16872]|uniref:Peptidase C14 caspase domain-containing protein n=1 Tax=Aspergillus aculeatus (strain ATCC 16872 / CBS 172.66 / WB 5094) TaxID=690307 RepID=A0A1L9WT18_ASPA1|nr:uncharacterized protein ASPACDRAFT_120676 [Aspergillus aculeatus ATCC 16872]OJJ99340.1 hypothetical protein ASPACDRAFT_120676 [Aspergillus aculeatus ATCC 16872]